MKGTVSELHYIQNGSTPSQSGTTASSPPPTLSLSPSLSLSLSLYVCVCVCVCVCGYVSLSRIRVHSRFRSRFDSALAKQDVAYLGMNLHRSCVWFVVTLLNSMRLRRQHTWLARWHRRIHVQHTHHPWLSMVNTHFMKLHVRTTRNQCIRLSGLRHWLIPVRQMGRTPQARPI